MNLKRHVGEKAGSELLKVMANWALFGMLSFFCVDVWELCFPLSVLGVLLEVKGISTSGCEVVFGGGLWMM